MTRINTPADVLRRSAEVLETDGWTQGKTVRLSADGQRVVGRCSLGALDAVRKEMQIDSDPRSEFEAWNRAVQLVSEARIALRNRIGSRDGSITTWNDDESRTSDEVVETFRAAADELEAVTA